MSVTTESPAYTWIKEVGIAEGIKKGRAEGIETGKLENARTMIRKGYPLTDIIEITGLTAEQLKNAGINGKTQ